MSNSESDEYQTTKVGFPLKLETFVKMLKKPDTVLTLDSISDITCLSKVDEHKLTGFN